MDPKSPGRKPATYAWEKDQKNTQKTPKSPGPSRVAEQRTTQVASTFVSSYDYERDELSGGSSSARAGAAAGSSGAGVSGVRVSGSGGVGVGAMGAMGGVSGVSGVGGESTPLVVRRARLKQETQTAFTASSGVSGTNTIHTDASNEPLDILRTFETIHIPGIEPEADDVEDNTNKNEGENEGKSAYFGSSRYHQQVESLDGSNENLDFQFPDSQRTLDPQIQESPLPRKFAPLPLSETISGSTSTHVRSVLTEGLVTSRRGSQTERERVPLVGTATTLNPPYPNAAMKVNENTINTGGNIIPNTSVIPASLESSILDLADIMQALGAARTSIKRERPRRKKTADTPQSPDSNSTHSTHSTPQSTPDSSPPASNSPEIGSPDSLVSSPFSDAGP